MTAPTPVDRRRLVARIARRLDALEAEYRSPVQVARVRDVRGMVRALAAEFGIDFPGDPREGAGS